MEKQTFTAAQKLQEAHSSVTFLAEQLPVTRRVAGSPQGYQGQGKKKSHRLQLRLKRTSGEEEVFRVALERPELR